MMEYCGGMKNIYKINCIKKAIVLVDEPKIQPNITFFQKELAVKIIMNCRMKAAPKFRLRLIF